MYSWFQKQKHRSVKFSEDISFSDDDGGYPAVLGEIKRRMKKIVYDFDEILCEELSRYGFNLRCRL